jgi:uncharacterized protein YeaO (DUF488 family)
MKNYYELEENYDGIEENYDEFEKNYEFSKKKKKKNLVLLRENASQQLTITYIQ